jgi:hypothetical protein
MIRKLAGIEGHLASALLHLDAAADEAGFMIAADFDRVFGGGESGNRSRDHAQSSINAMLRGIRRELAKLDALEVR